MITISIAPHDPLIARDSRPFGAEGGNRARTLEWPYPSVVAGTLRTLAGKRLRPDEPRPFDDPSLLERLRGISVAGPLPLANGELYFPAPRDLITYTEHGRPTIMPLRPAPLDPGEGTDLNSDSLWPMAVHADVKATQGPSFWPARQFATWLALDTPSDFAPCDVLSFAKEERVHVSIRPDTQMAADGMLFTTEGLAIPHYVALAARVATNDPELWSTLSEISAVHPFGGERRLACISSSDEAASWACPDMVRAALGSAAGVRMVLITPALFSRGWLPGWLNPETLEGTPPGTGVRLRLRGACVERWRPISGWNLEKRAPKPIRRLAPAGSVYFFEALDGPGSAQDLAAAWLQPISDAAQDRTDGFGLAAWGIWHLAKTHS